MEIIGKVSKGTKMDQIYIPKSRMGFEVGNYVTVRPLESQKKKMGFFSYGVKELEPIKAEMIRVFFEMIKEVNDCRNIVITGSFLDRGFSFKDIDILVINDSKNYKIKNLFEKKTGIKAHLISITEGSLKKSLEVDPKWRLMLSRCVSERRLTPIPKRKIDYIYLDAELSTSRMLIDNFSYLNGRERYKLVRNLIAIMLFFTGRELSEKNVEDEIKKEMEVDSESIKENLVGNSFLKKYKGVFFKLQSEIMKHASKQKKIY
ncbi:MAG: hypothetical protein NUV46_00685 [Nanoarchaeota archaeon]|nr:hypothetical protein [Nanoarchaeota archaeon]